MSDHIRVPIRVINGVKWAWLSMHGHTHEICGEDFRQLNDFSLSGQHRVRLIRLKKNVHWKIPAEATLDISGVAPATPPRRPQRQR